MAYTPLTADNSAMVLIDHEVGFSNLIGSHTIDDNLNGALALAKTAKLFELPMVVTSGPEEAAAGPLYPELQEVLGDHPVVYRDPVFDAFDNAEFTAAVEATGRKKLVMAGIQTDVCLALTALTALNKGYEVYAVVDASAATTKETHDYAMQRMIQAGAIPVNWLAVGAELLRGWVDQPLAPAFGEIVYQHLPSWKHLGTHAASIRKLATQ
ncbi:isochorismatase family protein [Paramicrobacterium chengjingii]|uniref:Isochorismatase family protein n=1 Tax=Paramicrobacterium chengjingii TaxID=2769067 RepID=A0ABX6YEW3_9MICO|nr:isochorismatase family protein [Microbacterium chengjingii]QPZ37342.1 isochorismatase family protein [Microbacterium chengjingii]